MQEQAKKRTGRRPRVMTWRQMVSLPEDMGAEIERMAEDRLIDTTSMMRLLLKERLDEIHAEEKRREREDSR